MPIRLGSNEHFESMNKQILNINKIGAGDAKGKLHGFDRFCATISRIMRKCLPDCIMDKEDWKARVTGGVDSLKKKCSKQQITHSIEVDKHVIKIIKVVQKDAFVSFMSQIPTLKAKFSELKGFDQISKHQPLLNALNAIDDQIKLNACVELANLGSILEVVSRGEGDGPESDAFYAKVEELKSELANKESDENKFIAENLANLTNALTDWKVLTNKLDSLDKAASKLNSLDKAASELERTNAITEYTVAQTEYAVAQSHVLRKWDENSKSIENLLSDAGLNKAKTIPVAREWAAKMKEQKATLIVTLNKTTDGYAFRKHGFFQDRVDEAKRVAKSQQKSLGKLDLSFANYLADKTLESWNPLADNLNTAKSNTIERNKQNINKTLEELTQYSDVKSVKRLNKNKAIYEKCQAIFEKFWNLDAHITDVGIKKASIERLTRKINKNYSKKKANKLAAIYAGSAEKLKTINTEFVTYTVKHGYATLSLAFKKDEPFGIADNAEQSDCNEVLIEADKTILAFSDLLNGLEYLKNEQKNTFTFENWASDDGEIKTLTFDEVQAWAQGKCDLYKAAWFKANARANVLVSASFNASNQNARVQARGAAEDKAFLDQLLLKFDRIEINDDGNCFFHTIKAGLDRLSDPRFDQYKAMSAEELRVALYDYMKNNSADDEFQAKVATSLSVDVINYAEAALSEVGRLLLEAAPDMRQIYTDFRRDLQLLPTSDERGELKDNLSMKFWNAATVIAYADAMANNKTYVGLTEAFAMKHMLNIRIDLHSPGQDDGLSVGDADLPMIHILRPKHKAHFELLVEKKPVLDAEPETI